MKISLLLGALSVFFPLLALSQSSLDEVLKSVVQNNSTLKAQLQKVEAQRLEGRVGLNPANPSISYDYMYGTPSIGGNQTDLIVVQEFDFPTAYGHKKQLALDIQANAMAQMTRTKQAVLLEAQEVCLHLIGLRKQLDWLVIRQERTNRMKLDLDQKLKAGEATILEFNKAQLSVLAIKNEMAEVERKRGELAQRLNTLNGGIPIQLTQTDFPVLPELPSLETLFQTYRAQDPLLVVLNNEVRLQQTEIDLAKSLALPKIETGYHYQGILGQTFQGVHLGLTIPLWEDRNKISANKAQLLYSEAHLLSQDLVVSSELRALYERYEALNSFLTEYQTMLSGLNEMALLDQSLALGNISAVTYFIEESFYSDAQAIVMATQLEIQLVYAAITKCQVLSIN
jgi:outer membrane protein, heavy metal efflux system